MPLTVRVTTKWVDPITQVKLGLRGPWTVQVKRPGLPAAVAAAFHTEGAALASASLIRGAIRDAVEEVLPTC